MSLSDLFDVATLQADLRILGRVLFAMVLGALIGAERELADKPAGFRTHMLVAGSAALLVGISDLLVDHVSWGDPGTIQADPIRVVEAMITGIAFLGAGTILRRRGSKDVEGLTTAASLLLTGGIGLAVALDSYLLAIGTTFLGWVALRGARHLEDRFTGRSRRSG